MTCPFVVLPEMGSLFVVCWPGGNVVITVALGTGSVVVDGEVGSVGAVVLSVLPRTPRISSKVDISE